jgi:sulfatase maturation enzyme AslB (radical SAM superfamily)
MQLSNHLVNLINQHNGPLKFKLSGDGDPFASHIYSNMLEKLNLIDNKNIEVEIATNGILIKSHWSRMSGIHNNVVRFIISFDAGSPEIYNITRRGSDWDKLIENCKYIIEWKKNHYSNMNITANFVIQNINYRDIHKFIEITDTLGFDNITFQKVTDWGKWVTGGINYFIEHAVWQETHPNFNELIELINNPILDNPKVHLTNLTYLRRTK